MRGEVAGENVGRRDLAAGRRITRATSSSGDGEYIMCDDETYTAVPQGSGSFIGCDKAGDSKCQEKVDEIAH